MKLNCLNSSGILRSIAVGRKLGSKKALAMLEHMVATQRNLVEELRYSIAIIMQVTLFNI